MRVNHDFRDGMSYAACTLSVQSTLICSSFQCMDVDCTRLSYRFVTGCCHSFSDQFIACTLYRVQSTQQPTGSSSHSRTLVLPSSRTSPSSCRTAAVQMPTMVGWLALWKKKKARGGWERRETDNPDGQLLAWAYLSRGIISSSHPIMLSGKKNHTRWRGKTSTIYQVSPSRRINSLTLGSIMETGIICQIRCDIPISSMFTYGPLSGCQEHARQILCSFQLATDLGVTIVQPNKMNERRHYKYLTAQNPAGEMERQRRGKTRRETKKNKEPMQYRICHVEPRLSGRYCPGLIIAFYTED